MFGLDENKKLMELSEGMKVKFSLATALSHHAQLLILDEPTSGLDPVSREELLEIFQYLAKQGTAILFSTHITSDLEKCADAITYIQNGSVVASKPYKEFLKDYPEQNSLEDIMVHLERKPKQFDQE
jgi:ABC-2 type transport system ATP-binding protein